MGLKVFFRHCLKDLREQPVRFDSSNSAHRLKSMSCFISQTPISCYRLESTCIAEFEISNAQMYETTCKIASKNKKEDQP